MKFEDGVKEPVNFVQEIDHQMLAFFDDFIKIANLTENDAKLTSIVRHEVLRYLKVVDPLYHKPRHQNRERFIGLSNLLVQPRIGQVLMLD